MAKKNKVILTSNIMAQYLSHLKRQELKMHPETEEWADDKYQAEKKDCVIL